MKIELFHWNRFERIYSAMLSYAYEIDASLGNRSAAKVKWKTMINQMYHQHKKKLNLPSIYDQAY